MDVWADELALFIWHADTPADLTPIKEAKLALRIEAKVVPIAVSSIEPLPADARILAIGTRPPWVNDYALVTERTSPAGLQRALAWCLGDHEDEKATTVLDILSSLLPPTEHGRVREMSAHELEGERKMLAYLGATE